MNILNKLTIKHLSMNKKRTIVTIIGVILSTALMIGIGLLLSSIRDYAIKEVINNTGNYHARINDLSKDNINALKKYDAVKNLSYQKAVGFAYLKEAQNEYKPYLYISSMDNNFSTLLKLTEGRLPETESEIIISKHIKDNGKVNLKIGDTLSLEVGARVINEEETLDNIALNVEYNESGEKNQIKETLNIKYKKDYKIVGIVERSFTESYDAAGYSVFTFDNEETGKYTAYVEYNKLKDVRDKTEVIAKSLGLDYSYKKGTNLNLVQYNEQLLNLAGESRYGNFNNTVVFIMIITLSLISIACIIVIYNSFAISVMERKKQFGLFSSIGATRKQLKKTVFFEAFIVGIIGIVLGLLGALVGIGVVLKIVNHLLEDMFLLKLDLVIYPLFIIIPIIFMIIVLIISAHLPAKRASKISPIEAIRLNDDIKIKGKKLKTSNIVNKLFGVEGELALKSIKRNKKKYRITIISLFISIVLFISFSSYVSYIIGGARITMDVMDFDMHVSGESTSVDNSELYNNIKNIDGIKNPIMYNSFSIRTDKSLINSYTNEYKKALKAYEYEIDEEYPDTILIINLHSENYQNLKKQLGLKDDKNILINNFNLAYFNNNSKKNITGLKFKDVSKMNFNIVLETYKDNQEFKNNLYQFHDLIELKEFPSGIIELMYSHYSAIIIVPNSVYQTINYKRTEILNNFYEDNRENNQFSISFSYSEKDEVTKLLEDTKNGITEGYFHYTDIKEEQQMINNLLLVINILVYGFITLVTLIGVTSVFNTINTSMALRKKEFAVLRSIGLSPKGFNKILQFETLIFGFKSLLYALPASLGIIFLIHLSMSDLVGFSHVMIPWSSVIIAVIGVFVIVAITMSYTTKKIKKENILDAIREENI